AEALLALDRDVQPAVVEPVEHVDHRRTRADLAHPIVVREDEPELAVAVQALSDQLLVAQLEDVEWNPLRGEQHDPEREEAELVHQRPQPAGGSRRSASWSQ